MRTLITAIALLGTFASAGLAQVVTTIKTDETKEFGEFLVTGDNRPVYLFTTDTRATVDAEAKLSCTSMACLNAWPLVTTQGEPQAEGNADADMLGTLQHEDQMVVTYNGWPLYLYQADEDDDTPQGQDISSFGGEWYLVTPEGEEVHSE